MERVKNIGKNRRFVALAAERHMNKNIFPIMSLKGKEIGYPFIKKYKDRKMRCTGGKLGPKNMMIMDVLGTYVMHSIYSKSDDGSINFSSRIPTERNMHVKQYSHAGISFKILKYIIPILGQHRDGCIPNYLYCENALPSSIDRIYGRIKRPLKIQIKDSYLKEQLTFLKEYSSKELHDLIKSTGECALEMTYPIRFFDGKNYQNFFFINNGIPSTLYRLLNVNVAKTSKNGHILDREYEIMFDTFLGYYFTQNCTSCYTDLIPEKFYSLSDYAQLLYRFLILPYYGKAKNPLNLEEIRYRLDLKTRDTYMARKVVRRILEELEAHEFIKQPKEISLYRTYLYSYIKSSWKERKTKKTNSGTDLV